MFKFDRSKDTISHVRTPDSLRGYHICNTLSRAWLPASTACLLAYMLSELFATSNGLTYFTALVPSTLHAHCKLVNSN